MAPPHIESIMRNAPPPYSQNAQNGPEINDAENRWGHRNPPGPSRTRRPNPTGYPTPSMYPSLPNEQSGLLNPSAPPGRYQTMPSSLPVKKRMFTRFVILTIIATSVVNSLLFYIIREVTRDELDPVARERVRREWNKEVQSHQVFVKHAEAVRAQWVLETQEHERERSVMIIERRTWQAERKWQEEKLNQLRRMIDQDRRNWETEKSTRERDWERKRREEAAERRRREDEERRRAGMHWEDLIPSQRCSSHGTREYTAKLVGIPWGYNHLSTCRETEVEIHGKSILPQSCEERGSDGVWAKWIVNFQEPTCTTWWSNLVDKGCTAPGSHTRRYEQHLENIPWGDDWKVMCTTAPTDFLGHHFESPTSCANWGRHGIFGYWDVRDFSC